MQRHQTTRTLDYGVESGVPVRWRHTVALAIVLGLGSGFAWFFVGEWLDGPLGNAVAWFVCPLAFPVALCLSMSLLAHRRWQVSPAKVAGFVACFYAAHWMPMAVLIASWFLGGMSP